MKLLPHTSAMGNIHNGTMTGKLNGVMPTATPSGWRSEKQSTPVPTLSENSPLVRCGAPQANSTTSSPRVTSPAASLISLPCSEAIRRASSARRASTISLNLNNTRARRSAGVAAQAGKAARAARTAASTSASEASATRVATTPKRRIEHITGATGTARDGTAADPVWINADAILGH